MGFQLRFNLGGIQGKIKSSIFPPLCMLNGKMIPHVCCARVLFLLSVNVTVPGQPKSNVTYKKESLKLPLLPCKT